MGRWIPCGPFVNQSERLATERLRSKLDAQQKPWILLSNLRYSASPQRLSDEIDLVALLLTGVCVIEVKHWDQEFLRSKRWVVEEEADRINDKAKRIKGRLAGIDPGFVVPRLLITRGECRFNAEHRPTFRGVSVFGLSEWRALLEASSVLTEARIEQASRLLEPRTKFALNSPDLRHFADFTDLKRLSDDSDDFHRCYRGTHPTRRDKVILHLYDLSASSQTDAEQRAQREFDVIQQWQKSPYIPNLMDSFREAAGYPGELYYFSLIDAAATPIAEARENRSWTLQQRLGFVIESLRALQTFHQPSNNEPPLIHRNIHPRSLCVRWQDGARSDQPLFTDFRFSRLEGAQTFSLQSMDFGDQAPFVPPEVASAGLPAATRQSDIFALCATLRTLFSADEPAARQILALLDEGCKPEPAQRADLAGLIAMFEDLGTVDPPTTAAEEDTEPSCLPNKAHLSRHWDEDTVVEFQQANYKILTRLGHGGIGDAFKVVEIDHDENEKFGTYVAKAVIDPKDGEIAIHAYRRARAYTTHPHLSVIHAIAPEWQPQSFVALLKWVEGQPLDALCGVLSIYAEDLHPESQEEQATALDPAEQLALQWLEQLCDALSAFHQVGLVHGDVSPKNIIVQQDQVALTDYDTVVRIDEPARGGTLNYCSPEAQQRAPAQASDDLFALAATFFHILTDREPFLQNNEIQKDVGLNWADDQDAFPLLRPFLEKATHREPQQRFADAAQAKAFLSRIAPARSDDGQPTQAAVVVETFPQPQSVSQRTEQEVPWLKQLLSAYPGSRYGNVETRGLDSDFAHETYVETQLDRTLLQEIQHGAVNLVLLFGNAGDGKTAFLQHLAERLGAGHIGSAQRIWEYQLANGHELKVNLDGSASWKGRSANALLDDIFSPFQHPDYPLDRTHLVAINSGKLLEWLEAQPEDTYLTRQLRDALLEERPPQDSRLRLIDLNARSLVGAVEPSTGQLQAEFFETLLERLLGGREQDQWAVCPSCLAQERCTAWQSIQRCRDAQDGPRLRQRLLEALQACHQRGEIHITARELRAALSYILFGLHTCADLHADLELRPEALAVRAFDPHSPQRQGELLTELAKLDPALDSDPLIDRDLVGGITGRSRHADLARARRRAYFERPDGAVKLAESRHYPRFRTAVGLDETDRARLCRDLCAGIARLDDLPPGVPLLDHGLALRITPQTPTETTFWVIKPWERFDLEISSPAAESPLESLPTHLHLVYRMVGGARERLRIDLELFHRLLELKDGLQLMGNAEEGRFANLSIFIQRLAQEDFRELYAWHPAEEQQVWRLRIIEQNGRQQLVRESVL